MTYKQTTVYRKTKAQKWRDDNAITDWEFAEIGALLCDHDPRDLALMIVRLQQKGVVKTWHVGCAFPGSVGKST